MRLNNLQLKKEADLRYALIQVRDQSQSVIVTGAVQSMKERLHERLRAVIENTKAIISVTRNLGFVTVGYNYLIQLVPLLVVAPLYLQGKVEFGVVTQSAMAFAQVIGAVLIDRHPVRGVVIVRRGERAAELDLGSDRPGMRSLRIGTRACRG